MFNIDKQLLIYLTSVTTIALLAYIWLHYRVSSFKDKRVRRIKKLIKNSEATSAISTDVLSKSEEQQEKKQIVQGVQTRFTIIYRTFFFFLVAIWLFALSLPFVGRLPSTFLSIMVAVSTAVVGIAARPLVENMISGIVISFSKQLRVGDTLLMDEQYGTVEDISITHTKIKTWDWKRYVIPNSRMLNKEFTNYTLNDSLLWAYIEFNVSYDADLEQIKELALDAAARSESCNLDEPPQFWVMELGRESACCWLAAWAESPSEAWTLKSEMRTNILKEFKAHGISTHSSKIHITNPDLKPS